jgi:hypothetical protein
MVQESLLTKYSMLHSNSTDYKVIQAAASKAIQEAMHTYLGDNPTERQVIPQQTQTQGLVVNGKALEFQMLAHKIKSFGSQCSKP